MRLSAVSLAGLVALSSVVLLSQQQQERPTFKTGVELVQLDVVVLDGKRQPVNGLSASDFTVLDNGTPATIRAFTPVELARRRPGDAVWAGDVETDVMSNRVADDEGRLVVILMDRSIPPGDPVVKARKIANAAVDALGPLDLAAIVSTNNNAVQSGLIQSLTSDRSRLKRTINEGDPSTGISAEAEALMNKDGFQMTAMNDTRCPCGTCVLETMTRVAEATQHAQRRRKLLLFVGSNIIWQTWAPASAGASNIGCEGRLKDARNAMFAAVDRANLTVHSIDPQGVVNDSPQAPQRTPPPRSPIDRIQAGHASSMRERENLSVLPERTGGRTIVARNEAEALLPDLLRESETYYVIGIERAVSKRADGARSIEVKIGRKGLRVVAPREYLGIAPTSANNTAASRRDASESSPVDEALTRLLPNSALPLSLALTTFAPANAGKPVVRVNVEAGAFARADGTDVPLDVVVIAADQAGRVVASARQKSTIAAKRGGSGPPTEVNIQSQLELEPATYDIRVAVSDPATNRVASVFSTLAIVPYRDAPVSLSSVSVEASSPGRAPVPTTRRAFKKNDVVRAVFQIYQGTERTDALSAVSMRVRILDAKGAAVRDESLPFAESAFTNRRADCVITLPLSKLASGEYLLKLDASTNRHTSGRAVRFVVE